MYCTGEWRCVVVVGGGNCFGVNSEFEPGKNSHRRGHWFIAAFCSQYLEPNKHSVSIWATFSSLTRSLQERQMGWFVENKPHLSPFQQCTSLSVKCSLGAHRQEENIFLWLLTETASELELVQQSHKEPRQRPVSLAWVSKQSERAQCESG